MEYLLNPTQDNIALNQLHLIVTDRFNENEISYLLAFTSGFRKALKKFGFTSAILSLIEMSKDYCITKEKYEEMYKTDEESETRMDLSVGEDLETFIVRIKNGEINKDTILEDGDYKKSFLLCLLDKEERKKLEQKDKDFMKTFDWGRRADIPEAEWNASESNLKFSRSVCTRLTYFIDVT